MADEFQGEPVIEHDADWAHRVLNDLFEIGAETWPATVHIRISPLAPAPWHHATLTVILHADHTWSYE